MQRDWRNRAFTAPWLSVVIALSLMASGCQQLPAQNPTSGAVPALDAAHERAPQWRNRPQRLNFQPVDAATYAAQCERETAALHTRLGRLQAVPAAADIDYLLELDNFFNALDQAYNLAQLYANVHADTALRSAASDCELGLDTLHSGAMLSPAIYQRLSLLEPLVTEPDTLYYWQKLIRDYRNNGVDRDAATREAVLALQEQIKSLGQQFDQSIREDVRYIKIAARSGLDGLPDDYIARLPQDENGQWLISTNYPDALPFFRYAHNDAYRRALYALFRDRAYPQNEAVLQALIGARHKLAVLLGYASFADYATATAMIESAQNAQQFIDEISAIAQPYAANDYAVLLAELRRIDPSATHVGEWQKSYLENRVRQRNYQLDASEVREYFAYNDVKQGVFTLVADLFDIEIVPWPAQLWHPSVEAYAMRDADSKVLGYFMLDMHPREGKYNHAAHFGIKAGVAGVQLPISALVCNFPQPVDGAKDGDGRALLEHSQVETFLHEFGHLLHSILGGQQRWYGNSGIATERDFVEAPSQLLEEWVWHYPTLEKFARDAKGRVIPAQLVTKMSRARHFGKGLNIRTQMFYAALSLQYYRSAPEQLDLTALLRELQLRYSLLQPMHDTHFFANFGHLVGYSARYYTYMWSQVIAADLHAQFAAAGLHNKALAQRYREQVLQAGGSAPAAQLLKNFFGRPFDRRAFSGQLAEHYIDQMQADPLHSNSANAAQPAAAQ